MGYWRILITLQVATITIIVILMSSAWFEISPFFLVSFKRIFGIGGIEVLEWICIPAANTTITDTCNPPERELIVFNSESNYSQTVLGIPVNFSTSPIPADYRILFDHTAIINGFLKLCYPSNIYHFVSQYYVPFHYLLGYWMKSNLTKNAKIFFPKPLKDECIGQKFASFFLRALPFINLKGNETINYHAHPGRVCFRYGLLSDIIYPSHALNAINDLKKFYGIEEKSCSPGSIILSKRNASRIWTNIEETLNAIKSAGYLRAKIVDFAEIPLREQLEIASCTKIFVAPRSAAQTWSYFMPLNSVSIEIAWPRYGWTFFNSKSKTFRHFLVKFVQLEATNITGFSQSREIQMNWIKEQENMKFIYYLLQKLSDDQIMKWYPSSSLGKHCNFTVNTDEVVKIIKAFDEFSSLLVT